MAPQRRIIAVGFDDGFDRELETALADLEVCVEPARTCESAGTGPEIALWVVVGELGEVPGTAPILAIASDGSLARMLELMASERVAAVVTATDVGQIAAAAKRALDEDPFGAAKILGSMPIERRLIGDYEDKVRCLAELVEFVDTRGVPASRLESIEQCVDEILMNALYAAPVDERGERIFVGVPTRKRITRRTGEAVTLQYGGDRTRFVVAVRDAFGSLTRSTVLRVLHKGLHADDKVDRKAGGAGLGMYLVANAASGVQFHVIPGVACEVVCVFDLTPAPIRLRELEFLERADSGQKRAAPARAVRSAAARKQIAQRAIGAVAALGFVLALVLASVEDSATKIAIAADPGTTIELDGRVLGTVRDAPLVANVEVGGSYLVVARREGYETERRFARAPSSVTFELAAVATVELDTQPSDAIVEIDGVRVGATPLALRSLVPGSTVTVVLTKPGYRRAEAGVTVPARGGVGRIVKALEPTGLVRVRLESNPPGARVRSGGDGLERTYTPADVFVEPDVTHHFTLEMHGFAPLTLEVDVGRDSNGVVKRGDLVPAR